MRKTYYYQEKDVQKKFNNVLLSTIIIHASKPQTLGLVARHMKKTTLCLSFNNLNVRKNIQITLTSI